MSVSVGVYMCLCVSVCGVCHDQYERAVCELFSERRRGGEEGVPMQVV